MGHGIPVVATHYRDSLIDLLGPSRSLNTLEQSHKDIACSAQAMYEEAFFIYFGLFIKGLLVINSVLQAVVVQTRLLMARSLDIHRLSRFTFRRQLVTPVGSVPRWMFGRS